MKKQERESKTGFKKQKNGVRLFRINVEMIAQRNIWYKVVSVNTKLFLLLLKYRLIPPQRKAGKIL